MSKPDAGFDYDRYRQLLADADDEPKRLAFINILIEEKARDSLARQSLRARLAPGRIEPGRQTGSPSQFSKFCKRRGSSCRTGRRYNKKTSQ
jgi:hypothetical protein